VARKRRHECPNAQYIHIGLYLSAILTRFHHQEGNPSTKPHGWRATRYHLAWIAINCARAHSASLASLPYNAGGGDGQMRFVAAVIGITRWCGGSVKGSALSSCRHRTSTTPNPRPPWRTPRRSCISARNDEISLAAHLHVPGASMDGVATGLGWRSRTGRGGAAIGFVPSLASRTRRNRAAVH